nr:MAG TPA: hypothetical protein [Caudoviricetes sp.]DAX13489.1 MAG TPA: hypothetical protein [Bacteriophage sp.]
MKIAVIVVTIKLRSCCHVDLKRNSGPTASGKALSNYRPGRTSAEGPAIGC